MKERLNVMFLVAAYLAAVVAANLLASHYGASITPYTALGLVGFALIARDRLADAFGFGVSRWMLQAALIGMGSLLAYLVNSSAAQIAEASCVAFAASEAAEAVIYYILRKRTWLERANQSGVVGAAIDSYLFTVIAFGTAWPVIFGQFTAKVGGCLLFSFVIGAVKVRRAAIV